MSDYVLMPKRLTAENGAKAELIGEFDFWDEASESYKTVPWTTIKEIYKVAVNKFGKELTHEPSN